MSVTGEYDVAVIGGGVTGAATAYTLSRYQIRCVVLEKEADVGFGVSKANSGIVHAGFHYPLSTLKGRLEILGNLMFEKLKYELGFPFRRCGILMAAFQESDLDTVRKLYRRGMENRVPRIEICSRERMLELEPKLNPSVCGGLYAPEGGVVEPYRYVFSLMELARKNGVECRTDFHVIGAEYKNDRWEIQAEDGRAVRASYAVNAAGLYADRVSALFGAEEFEILARKGEEYLLDRTSPAYPSKVVFPVPASNSKGVLVIPTVEGTTMVGPTAEIVDDREDRSTSDLNFRQIFRLAKGMVSGISERDLITGFSGLRPALAGGDFYIEPSKRVPNFIQAAGIQSPGLTASPAIGEYIRELLKGAGLTLSEKKTVVTALPPQETIRSRTPEEADDLFRKNPQWTNIVCRCENISEAEIVEAIHHGHTTMDWIKFYTRAGMGRCQGGFCSWKIYSILSRETGIPLEAITRSGGATRILGGRLTAESVADLESTIGGVL